MKKIVIIVICLTVALLLVLANVFAQTTDLSGTWTGFTILGDGTRANFNLILEKAEGGYGGKINDDAGAMPEMKLKNVTFKAAVLAFEIDYPQGSETTLIKIELKHEADTLKGTWTDPDGQSNIIELERKK